MLSEVNTVISLATTLASLVVMVEAGWYKASQAVREFPSRVDNLKKLASEWQESLRKGGMSEDKAVKTKLDDVERILKAEELRVQRLKDSCCYGCSTKLTFSRVLTKAIDDAIKAIDEIPGVLKRRKERQQLVEENVAGSGKPLLFTVDQKYVPIERTIAKVRALLESEECKEPVVLFGGPGEGKTCMARHLALVYQLSGHNVPDNGSSTRQSSSPVGKFLDGVFFLRCGKGVDGKYLQSLVLLKELAEGLGGYSQVRTEETIEDTQARLRKLREDVCRKLKYQNALIILDDVWDTDIVRNIFVKARGVKYLITTQFERIWPDAKQAQRVKIDLPNLEEARRIIANLQFEKSQIPNNLKDLIEKIIQKVKFHPYELANVAFAIKDDKALEVNEWQSKLRDVSYLREGDPRRGPQAFGRSYSKKTLPDAILLGVDNFPEKTRSLLYMATICESESVPEQVFKLFFESIHSNGLDGFFSCRSDLEDAGLLQVENKKVLWSLEPVSFWSIYGRRQDIIRQKRKVEIESLVSTCLESNKSCDENEPDVVALLVILYGRLDWREKAARKTGILVSKMTKDTSRERNAVTEFIHLLFAGGGDGSEKQPHMWAKKVIWNYLIKGELDDSSMSDLLNFSQSALASCGALKWMAGELMYTRQLLTTQHQATLKGLVKFLSDASDSVFKILVTQVLVNLSYPRFEGWNATRVMVLFQTDFLSNVLVLLRANNAASMEATANALAALGNLTFDKDQSLLIGNFSESVMLEVIIGFVKEDAYPRVQEMSLYVLGRLCSSEEITRKILQFSGFLARIVHCCDKSRATEVQVKSIWILRLICAAMGDKIIEGGLVPGTVERLIALMAEDVNQDVQLEAVGALGGCIIPLGLLSYPTTEKGIEMVVLTQTDFLHNSLQLLLLRNKTRADILQNTLITLGNFAENEDARLSIGNFSGMLEAIIEMTDDHVETRVQENALFALRRLLHSPLLCKKIVGIAGVLDRFVELLEKDVSQNVKVHVSCAMSYISEHEEMRKVIRETSNVVSILADLIANDTKSHADLAHGAVKTITLIDFDKAEKLVLKSADAYRGRGSAKMILGRYNDALIDCDSGLDIDHGHYALLSQRSFVKAMLKDYSGSVKDISRAMEIEPDNSYLFQERGVLMRLIGDLDAALSDLNTALKLDPDDYEMLKHRGYVKFLLGDEEGALEDAELAILRKHQDSLPHGAPVKCLGALPVKYLEYKL